MKVLAVSLSVVMLLAGLPMLHGLLAFLVIDKLSTIPDAMPFFYLFTFPAWILAIIVYVIETYRRSFIRTDSKISNTLMLGLFGMIAPTAGLGLSPVAPNLGLLALSGVAVSGLVAGWLGALLFNFLTSQIDKLTGT